MIDESLMIILIENHHDDDPPQRERGDLPTCQSTPSPRCRCPSELQWRPSGDDYDDHDNHDHNDEQDDDHDE